MFPLEYRHVFVVPYPQQLLYENVDLNVARRVLCRKNIINRQEEGNSVWNRTAEG
jgi:hypothetical protein